MSDQDGERARRRAELWRETSLAHGAVHYLGLRSYVVSLSNLPDAFKLADRFVRCIDERTPGGVHLAASGLLLGEERAKRFA